MTRMVAAVRATLTVVALLAGVPILLVAAAGNPLPHRIPSAAQIQLWVDDPWQPQYVTATIRMIWWLAWALLTAVTVTAGIARARRWRWARLTVYLPGPVQSLAATLLGAATVTAAAAALPAHAAAPATTDDLHPSVHDSAAQTAAGRPTVTDHRNADRRAAPAAAPRRVGVKPGDTLWDISADKLGDPHRWPEIFTLNRGHVQTDGYALADPDEIDVGWVFTLPARHPGAKPADQSTTRPAQTPQPSADGPRTPHPAPTTPASPTASTSTHSKKVGDGIHASPAQPPGHPATPSSSEPHSSNVSPAPSSSAPPPTGEEHDAQATSVGPLDGVDLPGGWITVGLGGGLVTAVAAVWRRRRHRYQPTPITSPRLEDTDLRPPLAAMTRIRTSLRRTAPDTFDEQPVSAPTVREYQVAVVKPELPPVGPSGSDLAGTAALPLATGLGLTGDGALDAARGLLVATLASGSHDDPDAKSRVIIPAATLATLLGAAANGLAHLDRLTVTTSEADAITQLEEEIIRRSRLIADAQAADVHTWRDTDVHAEPLPQLLLIAKRPDPAWTNRLVTAVRLGHSVNIGAALIGDWPTGTTLTVAGDGTTGNDDTPRLTILDSATAIDMLRMLDEADGDSDSPAHAETIERPQPPTPTPTEPDVPTDQNTERHAGPVDNTPATATAPPAPAAPAAAGPLPVAVRVLGRPAVLDHDGQPSSGIRSKAVELLVYLAVNRHGADLSDIMEALFPDANLRRAGERLSTVVADLRKHIRRAAAAGTEQPCKRRLEPIPNTGSRYHLDPRIVRVDWWTVLDHYEATATATHDDQRLSHLTAAVEAAGGALAEGVEYDWIDTDREVIRRHRIKLHAHTAALLADTDPHRSWLLLEQACQIDPLCDELARTTMHAAAALGDADALRHRLTTLRDALNAHGLELSDETEALANELLRHLRPPPQP